MNESLKVAIIGSGPRGMSVLERMAAHLIEADNGEPVEIFLIDDVNIGTGRIWQTEQSHFLLMNTIAPEVSAFSGFWDGGEVRPGNGPSFAQWWQAHRDDYSEYGGYGPRAIYGEYLLFVLATVERTLPPSVALHKVTARVDSLDELDASQLLHLSTGHTLEVHRTVLATGHPVNETSGHESTMEEFAARTPGVSYLKGDSVASMDFSSIEPGQHVGIMGMGLTFYDLMSELTMGRGGKFSKNDDGSMTYHPSGREPRIFAGSRSGLPVQMRGLNQKPFDYEYQHAIFTVERALMIRERGDVYFHRDVLPLLEAEMTLVYAETKLRLEKGEEEAQKLRDLVLEHQVQTVEGVMMLAHTLGVPYPVGVNLYQLGYPFKGCTFSSPESFKKMMLSVLETDYAEAMKGNVNSPIKAALDVIRSTRHIIRLFVDFGGLNPESHREEFLKKFNPVCNALSAGPPAFRSLQLQALIRADILTVVGPSIKFEPSETSPCIKMYSPSVLDSTVEVKTVIDARVPNPNLYHDTSTLTRSLIESGIYTQFVNGADDALFETGGVNVTQSPFHPIRHDQTVADRLYVIGIPTEHTRWFMQSGSSRPNKWNDLMVDANAIAADILQRGKGDANADQDQHYAIARTL